MPKSPAPIAIGMPVQNGAEFISEAISSLQAQDFGDYELVISDNASTDETEKICRALALEDPRIRYKRLASPVPALSNFLSVLEETSSPLFMWAAHDDLWENNWIRTLMPCFETESTVGAIGRLETIDCDAIPMLGHPAHGAHLKMANSRYYEFRALRFVAAWEGAGKANLIYSIFRTHAVKSTMREALTRSVDFDCAVVLGLLAHGAIEVVPETTFRKRVCKIEKDAASTLLVRHSTVFVDWRGIFAQYARARAYDSESNRALLQYRITAPKILSYAVSGLVLAKRVERWLRRATRLPKVLSQRPHRN